MSEQMKRMTVDDLQELLPDVDLLRPLLDRALRSARPDPTQRWTGSGELGTVGRRQVDAERLADEAPILLDEIVDHVRSVYAHVVDAISAIDRDDWSEVQGALLSAGKVEVGVGRLREGAAFLEAARRVGERQGLRRGLIPVLLFSARLDRTLGRLDRADAQYREAAGVADDHAEFEAAARAWIGRGNLAVDRGRWALALDRYQKAEEWVGRIDHPVPERWHLPLNRSIVARRTGRLEDAERELDEARSRAKPFPEEDRDSILLNAEGQLRETQGRGAEAEELYRAALLSATTPNAEVTISLNLASLLADAGRLLEAGELTRAAEARALRSDLIARLPEVYRLLGRIAGGRGHADALVFFERALQLVEERELPQVERARTEEAYGCWELDRGRTEAGALRLHEAARIYRGIGSEWDGERIDEILNGSAGDEPDPDQE